MNKCDVLIVLSLVSIVLFSCDASSNSPGTDNVVSSQDSLLNYWDDLVYKFYSEPDFYSDHDTSQIREAYEYIRENDLTSLFNPDLYRTWVILTIFDILQNYEELVGVLQSNRDRLNDELILALHQYRYLERNRQKDSVQSKLHLDSALVVLDRMMLSSEGSEKLGLIISTANLICIRYDQDSVLSYIESMVSELNLIVKSDFKTNVDPTKLVLDNVECKIH